MKFNNSKCKVLHLACGHLHCHYMLGDKKDRSQPCQKGLGITGDGKLDKGQQCALATQRAALKEVWPVQQKM